MYLCRWLGLLGMLFWSSVSAAWAYTHFVDEYNGKLQVSYWRDAEFENALTFSMDQDLGRYSGITAFRLGEKAMGHWAGVPHSRLRLRLVTTTTDVDETNFQTEVKLGDGRHEIIIDTQGKLLQSLGLDPKFIAGLGIPITESNPKGELQGPFGGAIVDALVVVNTQLAWNAARMERVLTHEIGHALGLGHTNVVHLRDVEKLPVMFFNPTSQDSPVRLHQDDKAGLAMLYPTKDVEQHFGALQGLVQRQGGERVFGAVVIAIPEDRDPPDPVATWTDKAGQFALYGLLPGRYQLLVRAIDGSKSVQSMEPALHTGGIYRGATERFCPEYYNDNTFGSCDIVTPAGRQLLQVSPGRTTTKVQITEGAGNPSPSPQCILGSAPLLPGRSGEFPAQLPEGPRGSACAYEAPATEQFFPDASPEPAESTPDTSPERPSDTTLPEGKLTATCGCEAEPPAPSLLLGLLVLLLVGLRKPSARLWLACLPLLCTLAPPDAQALSIRRPNLTTLVTHAEMIVQVRVLSNTQTATPGGIPLLQTRFQVERTFKGTPPSTFTIQLLASHTRRFRLLLPHIPRFVVGQREILFVRRPAQSPHALLVALYYGVFDLKKHNAQWLVSSRGKLHPSQPLTHFVPYLQRLIRSLKPSTPAHLLQKRPRSAKTNNSKSKHTSRSKKPGRQKVPTHRQTLRVKAPGKHRKPPKR